MKSATIAVAAWVAFAGAVNGAGLETVKVSAYGFDPQDSTRFLQTAFDSGAKKVIVDRQAGDWVTRPLFLTNSNVEVVLEDGVNLVAKRGEFHGHDDSLVYIGRGARNVTLRGEGKATLRMHKADYLNPAMHYTFSGGHRMTVNILKSTGVRVRNLTILSSGGDGVYVGGARDVLLEDLVCKDHKRQGISITDAVKVVARRCRFDGTVGTPPACGVDIEPNVDSNHASEILFEDCTFDGNAAHGMFMYFGTLSARTQPVSIVFRRCTAVGNKGCAISLMAGNPKSVVERGPVRGTILFEDCRTSGNGQESVKIVNFAKDALDVRFRNCDFDDRGGRGDAAIMLSNAQLLRDFGGLKFDRCRVTVDGARKVCDFEAQEGIGIGGAMTGTLDVVRGAARETFDLAAFAARHVPHPERVTTFRSMMVDYRKVAAPPDAPLKGVFTPAIRNPFVYVQAVAAAGDVPVRFKSRKLRSPGDGKPCAVVQLLDEAGTDLGKFEVPEGDFTYTVKARGANVYRFEIAPKNNSTISVASVKPGGALLTDRLLNVFGGKNVSFHFRVPAKARTVLAEIAPEEPASAELLDAAGRTVASAPYQRKLSNFKVTREPTAADEIWTLRFPSVQEDLNFRVGGDAVPLLSTEREGTIRDRFGRAPAPAARISLTGRTTKDLPLYAPNEEMTFEVKPSGLSCGNGLFLDWKRTGDDGKTESGRVSAAKPFVYRTSLDRPGFVRLEARLVDEKGQTVRTGSDGRREDVFCDLGAGVDILKIRPAVPAPKDFDAFWKKRLDRLAAFPWQGRETLEEVPSALDSMRVWKLKVPCVDGVDLTGYLAVPKKPGKYPACAYFHGYGASFNAFHTQTPTERLLKSHANRILLSVSPHGFELGREESYYRQFRQALRSNGCEHGFDSVQNADPEKPYYCGMAYRDLRALAYLKSRPEWNGRDLAVTGGSQGGLQSIWCAALDRDVTACNIFIPWNCDIGGTEIGRNRGTWYVKWVPALGYYDNCSMAPRIPKSCRVKVSMAGLGDYICPPAGVMAFYNSLVAPKEMTFVQNAQHGNWLESSPQRFKLTGDKIEVLGR